MYGIADAARGAALNRLGHRLRLPEERTILARNEAAYLDAAGLTAQERAAVAARDWRALSAMGASIYALAKLGGALGTPLPKIVASFRDAG